MLSSLFTGASGINANGGALQVISNNIANLNNIGFKSSDAAFGDLVSASLMGGAGGGQTGRGVFLSSVTPLFSQGAFESTANTLDLAIDGQGMFIVSDVNGRYYTRAGRFTLDKEGNIVSPDGKYLQGYRVNYVDGEPRMSGSLNTLNAANSQSPPKTTTKVNLTLNLDATVTTSTSQMSSIEVLNSDGTTTSTLYYNYGSTVTVYDSQGGAHDVTLYFTKTADNSWTVSYVFDDLTTTWANDLAAVTSNLIFDTSGALVSESAGGTNPVVDFQFSNAVGLSTIIFDFGASVTEGASGLGGTTQFADDFSSQLVTQNGYGPGILKGLNVGTDGMIYGLFTNGQSRLLGQLALAKFQAPSALARAGNNLFQETLGSGFPMVGAANTSGFGLIKSNNLEMSNVDLANQFIKMIAAQRGFEASSRVITVSDQMLEQLVNLKR